MIDIGRCTSCQRDECLKPKARDLYPEQGCADWQTKEACSIDASWPAALSKEVDEAMAKGIDR